MKVRRWIKRGVLGLLGLIVVAVVAVLIVLHTSFGREIVRKQIVSKLDDMFYGGGSIGKVEGSPFGTLILRDVVLNGPDGKPAISAKTVKLGLGLLPLLSKQARMTSLVLEDVDVRIARDPDGTLQMSRMIRPSPSSGWSIQIPDIQLHRGHVAYDTGTEWMNIDAIDIFGGAHMPYQKPLKAHLSVRGVWRERAAGLALDTVLVVNENFITIPSLIARAGAVTVAGADLRIVTPREQTPLTAATTTKPAMTVPIVTGTVIVNAPVVGVAQLVPGVELPADLAFAATISNVMPLTHVSLLGQVGPTPVRAMLSADLAQRHAQGVIATGELDLTALSQGKIAGVAGGVVMFQASPGETGKLPIASGVLATWGNIADVKDARASVAFDTRGERVNVAVGAAAPSLRAMVEGQIKKVGDVLTLERSTVIASTRNPTAASGGKAPVRGSVSVQLAASGALSPQPSLSVLGHVDGKKLRMQDLSVASMSLAIDARQLPRQPVGKAELRLDGIVRGQMQLGRLDVTAGSRPDGKIQVSARSKPKQSPWLFDLDALVTPPGRGEVVMIDVQRHHVRAGSGGNWSGTTGHIEIGPRRVLVQDLDSASVNGALAIAGQLDRLNGNFAAKVDATNLTLDNIDPEFRGTVDAHVDLNRTGGRFAGTVDLKGKGMALQASPHTFEIDAKISAAADKLVVDASASSTNLGRAKIALDVDAPKDITNLEAWKHLHRKVIRTGHLVFQDVDVAKIADLAGHPGEVTAGRLDGDLPFSASSTGGIIQVRDMMMPALRGTGDLDANLTISQSGPDELTPMLIGKVDAFGTFKVGAKLGIPDHLFDPQAWAALGPHAIHGISARLVDMPIDPAQLDRLGIVTDMRGRVSLSAEVTEAMGSAQLAVDVKQLRGNPIAQPVDAYLAAAIDDKGTNTTLSIRSGKVTLVDVKGKVPMTIEQLRANPRAFMTAPLAVTATIPSASAPALLGVFGRSEIIGGSINGTIQVTGTVGDPRVVAKLVGSKLQVPPGPRNKPVKTIESITVDGSYDGSKAKIAINGVQQGGSLEVLAEVDPSHLAAGSATIHAKAFDLVPLLAFAPGPAGGAAGRLDADLTVKGLDPRTARVAGELHLDGARLPVAPQVGTLRRAKVDITIGETQMKIDVSGRVGGGTVKLAGTIDMDGALPTNGNLVLTLRKVSPIGSVEPVIDADVTAKLKHEGLVWIADVDVRRASIDIPSGRGEKLKPVGAPADMVFANGKRVSNGELQEGPPQNASLIVNLTLHSTHVQSAELRTYIKGSLKISADSHSVGVFGNIVAEQGDLDLFGRRYDVDKAAVHFDGSTDPLLDVRITHNFSDVTTVTQVHGRLSKPELTMGSDPGVYSQGQLLGFLLGGEPNGDPQAGSARDKASAAGASFVANKLGGYVKNALPVDIDVLRYEASTSTSSAAVTVGTWISRSLFVAYRQHLESRVDENLSEAEVEYWLTHRTSVQATSGDHGYTGVDLLWRKRY
ncbi:hypothetical protein BH11MYX3_BH11MYX3_04340 [soil metagenome]